MTYSSYFDAKYQFGIFFPKIQKKKKKKKKEIG